jgi:hypothetical protein
VAGGGRESSVCIAAGRGDSFAGFAGCSLAGRCLGDSAAGKKNPILARLVAAGWLALVRG